MTWTRQQLEEAIVAYERVLNEKGQKQGSINTAVGDARRFVRWLDGEFEPRARSGGSVNSRAGTRARTPLIDPISVPAALRKLTSDWNERGRPQQVGIEWPRDRWRLAFPDQEKLWGQLPERLDRSAVRAFASMAVESEEAAETALIATLTWGFGWVGYGPHRADKMLISTPESRRHLKAVAVLARDSDAMAAYRGLAGEHRVKGLGVAFGTKYVTFCQPAGATPTALIHDELVSSWLAANGRADLRAGNWSPPTYEAYLSQMHDWAGELRITAEEVEFLIFQSEADDRGNQWSSRR
jgi:hypothetical protein